MSQDESEHDPLRPHVRVEQVGDAVASPLTVGYAPSLSVAETWIASTHALGRAATDAVSHAFSLVEIQQTQAVLAARTLQSEGPHETPTPDHPPAPRRRPRPVRPQRRARCRRGR